MTALAMPDKVTRHIMWSMKVTTTRNSAFRIMICVVILKCAKYVSG